MNRAYWTAALLGVLALALALRLHGIGNPIMDHPGWRQGDTAAIARNFAQRTYNIMYPQTIYNGPPPNYVELELQIVPFAVASLYKLFGVHEIFGRIVTLIFSLATVITIGVFARWLFASSLAGIAAAFFFAIFPGSVYYGRTFMPDGAMAFFLTIALYVIARFLDARRAWGAVAGTALLTLAYLAKPVAVLALAPLAALFGERAVGGKRIPFAYAAVLTLVPLAVLWLYDRRVASYAEWHWASGITRLHVLPALRDALTSPSGFLAKCAQFREDLGRLRETMLGTTGFLLTITGFAALPWIRARSKALLWGWLAGGLLYVFVVVTVERVDYYLLALLPPCALSIGGLVARWAAFVHNVDAAPTARYALLAPIPLLALAALLQSRAPVAEYYHYNAQAYRNALDLDRTLEPDALVVLGHYGPDVQYYVNRFGWEEDPALWTPFDEQSAIAKGARYFVSIEDNRLRHNLELCAWLARFPVRQNAGEWPVYETDLGEQRPGAQSFWRAFRNAQRAGRGRAFLDARGICRIRAGS